MYRTRELSNGEQPRRDGKSAAGARARARGEKDKEAAKSKKKKKGGKEDEKKKRALEKLLERHWTCPSCRAPLAATAEDEAVQLRRKAEQGGSWVQSLLGDRYYQGAGVRKDARQAERWYRAAMTDMSVMDGGPRAAFELGVIYACLLYTSPSPRDRTRSRMPSSA